MTLKRSGEILQRIRQLMSAREMTKGYKLAAVLITSKDEHMNRYLSLADCRLFYISGFSGSIGTAVITHNAAYLWTDSRYEAQALSEVDDNWIVRHSGIEIENYIEWMRDTLPPGSKVGVDPKTISYHKGLQLIEKMKYHSITLDLLETNIVDAIWVNRPKKIFSPLFVQPIENTGLTIIEKLTDIWDTMNKLPASVLLVTMLSDIAWTLNLRGSDIPYCPLFYAHLLILDRTFILFTDEERITPKIKAHLDKEMTLPYSILPYDQLYTTLQTLSINLPNFTWCAVYSSYASVLPVPQSKLHLGFHPVTKKKLVKTPNETKGMWKANIRDCAAICCTLQWLEENVNKRIIAEHEVASKLEEFREEHEFYVGAGKPTSSSYGKNTLIKNYFPTPYKHNYIGNKEIYLLSAAGHYRDGTACITRMMHFGEPNELEQAAYTKVLKGVIGLTLSVFPNNIRCTAIDVFARKFIWESGFDYDFRTGFGVGVFLKLNEDAIEISKTTSEKIHANIEANMFIAIEPVYSLRNYYLYMMNVLNTTYADPDSEQFLTFKTVSFCPIQKKMIALDLITRRELTWINEYHKECRKQLLPVLDSLDKEDAIKWLMYNTEEIQSHEAIYAG